MHSQSVYIVCDDDDDKEILRAVWKELNYEHTLVFFSSGEEALQQMRTDAEVPFLILCDVNLPRMDAFEFKKQLLESPNNRVNYKSIPFVFWSTQASKEQIRKSYDLGGNGFFIKDSSLKDLKASLSDIMNYWLKSKVPERD